MARRVGESRGEREQAARSIGERGRLFFFLLCLSRTRRREREGSRMSFPSLPLLLQLTCIAATATAARANRPVSLWASMSLLLFF